LRVSPHPNNRRGAALVAALVAVMIVSTLGGVLVRRALEANRRASLAAREAQADALWRSGLDRARARLSSDPAYRGETWAIPAKSLGGRGAGRVTIRVEPAGTGEARATIQAEFPVDLAVTAPVRRRREVTIKTEVGPQARGEASS
jgi:type II secretory pathway component PulK